MSRALVISGGGSKGAFAVGVIKYLAANYPAQAFDMYIGTSTGALIAPLAAMNEIALLEKLYTTTKTSDVVKKRNIGDAILSQKSVLSVNDGLWKLIKQYYTPEFYAKLLASGKDVYINTTCLQTEEMVVYGLREQADTSHYATRRIEIYEQFAKSVLASACQPVFMPPVKVNEELPGATDKNYQYVDGGVREYAGIEVAVQNGATEIVAILLSSGKPSAIKTEYTDILSIVGRTLDLFITDVSKNDLIIPQQYNEALKYIDAVKRKMRRAGMSKDEVDEYFRTSRTPNPFQDKIPITIHIIRPENPLGGGPGGLDFIPAEMKQMLATGQQSIGNYIAALKAEGGNWA